MKKYTIEIKWAIIFVIVTLLWMLGEKLTGLHSVHIDKHSVYTNLYAIPAILIYVLALRDKQKNFYNGSMRYMQGLKCGIIITAFITVLVPLSQYITSAFITPEYFPNVINYAVEAGNKSQEEAEAYFNLENYIVMGLISAPMMGIITSAFVAIFVRVRKK